MLAEGNAILQAADLLDDSFATAAGMCHDCTGKVVLTGIGKAGIIAEKISATLASTGTPSIFLHPVEALHGDLGRLERKDVVVALSNSGSTEELLRLLDHVKRRGAKLIAITGKPGSPLGRFSDVVLCYGQVEEACPLGAAPSVSSTCMLALGDALSIAVMKLREFQPEQYAAFHPGGALGRQFLKVEEVMTTRKDKELATAGDWLTVAQALSYAQDKGRRTGAMLLVNKAGELSGILTDADLRRALLEGESGELMQLPVADVMTRNPKSIGLGNLASEAEAILNEYRIDELPVVDQDNKPIGVIDVQDLLGLNTLK